MAFIRGIKSRIRGVRGTQQITRAMNLVAASKLRRARDKLQNLRPFVEETLRVTHAMAARISDRNNMYIKARPVNNTAVVVISADRGLCGGYNVNVSKAASALIKEKPREHLITVGTKARDYFRRRNGNIIRAYQGVSETPFYEDAADVGLLAVDLYESGEIDEIYLVYTEFNSVISHTPKVLRLLPLPDAPESGGYMAFEPDEDAFFEYAIPKYVSTVIYGAMIESAACEQGARMSSMENATKNSTDLINRFTLQYNRARQDAITQELAEIIGGAEAL
ncbi:MAG: ATP synthase F1 subunit gamma [Clostridiales bacterium]|jgi:F-type H+-transporting ATPase subunit gamma|nr:ATP synthase F1 subunit gamma [Clostridiales bacterium]